MAERVPTALSVVRTSGRPAFMGAWLASACAYAARWTSRSASTSWRRPWAGSANRRYATRTKEANLPRPASPRCCAPPAFGSPWAAWVVGWTMCRSSDRGAARNTNAATCMFDTGSERRAGLSRWIGYCNARRPHSSLGGRTPGEAYTATGDENGQAARLTARDEPEPSFTRRRTCPAHGHRLTMHRPGGLLGGDGRSQWRGRPAASACLSPQRTKTLPRRSRFPPAARRVTRVCAPALARGRATAGRGNARCGCLAWKRWLPASRPRQCVRRRRRLPGRYRRSSRRS